MKKYFFIGLGGFLGAILRLAIKTMPFLSYKELIPLNTLFINVTGSFVLALITTVALEVLEVHTNLRLGICIGFLGAYTTFSTLCKETSELIFKSHYFFSLSYVTSSIFLGLTAAYLGVLLGRKVVEKFWSKDIKELKEG